MLTMDALTLNSDPSSPSTPSSSSQKLHRNPYPNLTSPSPSPSSLRLWKPQAQRNLRNQWSKLASLKKEWFSASSSGRSHGQSLANAYLNQRYLPAMNFGAVSDMPNILENTRQKLVREQDLFRIKLLSSYSNMVHVVSEMTTVSSSMRCFIKCQGASPLLQYSNHSKDTNDLGDGGGTPVFTFWSVSDFENLAQELLQMFTLELIFKRFLLLLLISLGCEKQKTDKFSWSDKLYPEEFEDLSSCNLYCEQTCRPVLPRIGGYEPYSPSMGSNTQPDRETLQVYLEGWLGEVNIANSR